MIWLNNDLFGFLDQTLIASFCRVEKSVSPISRQGTVMQPSWYFRSHAILSQKHTQLYLLPRIQKKNCSLSTLLWSPLISNRSKPRPFSLALALKYLLFLSPFAEKLNCAPEKDFSSIFMKLRLQSYCQGVRPIDYISIHFWIDMLRIALCFSIEPLSLDWLGVK